MTTIPRDPTAAKAQERLVGVEPVGLRDVLTGVFYYQRVALLVGLIVLLTGTFVTFVVPPSYTARARLLILDATLYDMQTGNAAPRGQVNPGGEAVNVELQLLASSELHRETVRRELGPGATPQQIDLAVRQFEGHLNVSKLESSNVIEIVYRDRDPDKAAEALRLLLAAYFDERAEVLTSGRVGFLKGASDKAVAQLNSANSEIATFERLNGVVDVTEQISGAIALQNQLQQQLAETEATLAESRSSVEILRRNAKLVPRQIELFTDNSEAAHTIGTMEGSLFQLETRRADLAARYMATSPFVQQLDAQITALKAAITNQKNDATFARRTGYNNYFDTVRDQLVKAEANLAGVTARQIVIKEQIADSTDRLKSLIAISDTLARLHMQRDLLSDNVKSYSGQLEQANIQQNQASSVGTTNARVIEAPVPPGRRSNPRSLMLAASVFAAIVISATTVLILSSLRDTFLSPQEAERGLKLPVLCDLPGPETMVDPPRRDYGRLIAAIDALPAVGGCRVVLMLSVHAAEELTLTAEGLARALAVRAPGRVASLLLRNETDDVPAGETNGVRLAGGVAIASAALGGSRRRLNNLLTKLRAPYRYVIMTAPPVSSSFESVEIAPLADLVLLLIKAEATRRPVAEAVLTRVSYTGTEVSGLVMTGRRYSIPRWIYRLALNERLA